MKLVKWGGYPTMLPSIFDEDWPLSNWTVSENGLEVYETENTVEVKAQLPGIPEENVDIEFDDGMLLISGKYEETEEEKKKKTTIYKSSRQTAFNYSTSLPKMVDASKAVAEMKDGVVSISIPKTEAAKPKKIELKKK